MSLIPDEILNIIFSFLPLHNKIAVCKKYNKEAKNIMKCSSHKIVKWYKSKKLKKEYISECSDINEVIRFLIVKERRPKYSLFLPERIFYSIYDPLSFSLSYEIKPYDRTIRFVIKETRQLCYILRLRVYNFGLFHDHDNVFNPIKNMNAREMLKLSKKIKEKRNQETRYKNFKKIAKINRNISFSKRI